MLAVCWLCLRCDLQHRYADEHACDFDYKTLDRGHLEKANPKVTAEKLERL
jgi:hypothetical protein